MEMLLATVTTIATRSVGIRDNRLEAFVAEFYLRDPEKYLQAARNAQIGDWYEGIGFIASHREAEIARALSEFTSKKPKELCADKDGWTKETWKAFYEAVKPFMEGTHPTITSKEITCPRNPPTAAHAKAAAPSLKATP